MTLNDETNLSAIRSRILSNIGTAFPLIYGQAPGKNWNDQVYTIVTRMNVVGGATAVIVHLPVSGGTIYEVFATSIEKPTIAEALSSLLDATSDIIDKLCVNGKLEAMEISDGTPVRGGAYKDVDDK